MGISFAHFNRRRNRRSLAIFGFKCQMMEAFLCPVRTEITDFNGN